MENQMWKPPQTPGRGTIAIVVAAAALLVGTLCMDIAPELVARWQTPEGPAMGSERFELDAGDANASRVYEGPNGVILTSSMLWDRERSAQIAQLTCNGYAKDCTKAVYEHEEGLGVLDLFAGWPLYCNGEPLRRRVGCSGGGISDWNSDCDKENPRSPVNYENLGACAGHGCMCHPYIGKREHGVADERNPEPQE